MIFTALMLCAVSLSAQVPKPDLNRVRRIDVDNYTIRTRFDRPKKTVIGDTTVTFSPLSDDFRLLELDAVGLKFDSVTLQSSDKALEYRLTAESVIVTLDRAYGRGDKISVRFRYSTQPSKGVYFVDAVREGKPPFRDAQIWTQGEPEEARYWFPSYDFPDDKATSEQFITVEKDETVIGNGELVDVSESGKRKTYHFRMNRPHSTYHISFVVGIYVKLSDRYRDIPLGFYVYPGREPSGRKLLSRTGDMMRAFEELTAIEYPFGKYDQTIVSNFAFGGMENITATTLSENDAFLIEQKWGVKIAEDLISHELAHSWFGNMVTCRNWAELWLNESFATFMEAAYRERKYGRADYLDKIREDAEEYFAESSRLKKKRGLYNQLARPDDSIFDTITYQKGSAVIHTLRQDLGDDIFWRSIRLYLKRFKWKNVETTDLKNVFEEVSGRDLDRFFEQWVYGARNPVLRVTDAYDPQKKVLRLNIEQTQPVDEMSPVPFEFDLDVAVPVNGNRQIEKLRIRSRSESFEIPVAARPAKLVFDPDLKVPLVQIKNTD